LRERPASGNLLPFFKFGDLQVTLPTSSMAVNLESSSRDLMDLATLIKGVRKGANSEQDLSEETQSTNSNSAAEKLDTTDSGDALSDKLGDEPKSGDDAKDVFALQAASRAKRLAGQADGSRGRSMLGRVDARDLVGNWTDSFGNTVCVYSVDAYSPSLIATLSNPPRRDFNLPMTRLPKFGGWRCGGAMLDSVSPTELSWRFPNGKTSVWRRNSIRAHGCNVILPQQMCMPADVNKVNGVPEVMYCLIPMPVEDNH
jgi:hypothetical protein